MKTLFIIFSLLLSAVTLGQSYDAFPDSNAIWREHIYTSPGNYHDQYGIIGDTIIQSLNYHKLYYQQSCLGDTAITTSNSTLIGAIREDSLKRVFFYNFSFFGVAPDSIYMLYDFSINVGDTVHFNPDFSFTYPYLVVDSIDSVWTFDHYRKRYHLQGETWIEGIGSLRSLLSRIMDYPTCFCINENVCYKHQNITQYLNPPFLDCYDMSAGLIGNDSRINNVKIYPNPTTNQLTIDTEIGINEIKIIDITGKLIKTFKQNTNILNVTDLPSGIYFIKLITEERTLTRKFVKQ